MGHCYQPPHHSGSLWQMSEGTSSGEVNANHYLRGVSEGRAGEEGSSMTGQREEERKRENEERLRVAKERRGEQLREAWRQHHPSEAETDEKGPPKKGPPAKGSRRRSGG